MARDRGRPASARASVTASGPEPLVVIGTAAIFVVLGVLDGSLADLLFGALLVLPAAVAARGLDGSTARRPR